MILGDTRSRPIWASAEWARTALLIDPLVRAARGRAAVRSTQFHRGQGPPNKRAISFGRIGWNSKGHSKWVHTVATEESAPTAEFLSTEVWAPSWTLCQKEDRAPELYFGFRNEMALGQQLAFNPYIVLAVAADQAKEVTATGLQSPRP